MRADAPMRPGDRAAQDDVDGTALFDAVRAPDMFGGEAADAAAGSAIRLFDDPAEQAARAQTDVLLHDMRRDLDAGGGNGPVLALDDGEPRPLRAVLDEIDGDEAALKALRDCL